MCYDCVLSFLRISVRTRPRPPDHMDTAGYQAI